MANGFFLGGVSKGIGEVREEKFAREKLTTQREQFGETARAAASKAKNEKLIQVQNSKRQAIQDATELAGRAKSPQALNSGLSILAKTFIDATNEERLLSGRSALTQDETVTELERFKTTVTTVPTISETAEAKRGEKQKDIAAGVIADPTAKDQFEPIFDKDQNIVGQRNIETGKVIADPRTPKEVEEKEQFEPVLDAEGNVIAQRNTTTGKVIADPRAPKEITPAQREAAGFAGAMVDANLIFEELGPQFASVLAIGGITPQALKSADRQRFEQAARSFINAQLRDVSGAAISVVEFESANLQYIPVPGDSDAVLEQKTRNRQVVTESLKVEAGGAFGELRERLPSLTVTINGRQFNVGDTVTNDRGQTGRVEQDGSITLLD